MEKREGGGGGGVIDTWQKKHRQMWVGSTRHPFVLSISDGTIDFSAFKTWLGQDYIFVRAFVGFVGSLMVKAWKEKECDDVEVILSGLAALKDELDWFKSEAQKWGLFSPPILPLKQNQLYCRFLESLMSPDIEYPVAITAFWAIEAVYQESFALCLGEKTPPELRETCQRWGNESFASYCSALKSIANRSLKGASEETRNKAELVFLDVLQHEVDFWNMSNAKAST